MVEHLEELRTRIVRIFLLVTFGWLIGWFLQPPLYGHLNDLVQASLHPAAQDHYSEAFRNATDPFMLKLKLSFYIGLILALPWVLGQLWGFVAPGLKKNERRPLKLLVPFSVALFATGCFFCWLILPATIRWFTGYLAEFPGTVLMQEPGTMIFFVLKMELAFGIGFQIPILVYGLGALDLLSAQTLFKHWRHASAIIFLLAAILTPSNDAISMLMMAVPLVLLFMLSVVMVGVTQRRKKRRLAAESAAEGETFSDLDA